MNMMSDKELLSIQQRKIKEQDKEIEDILGNVKKGTEQSKEVKNELLKQNLLLDDLEKDVHKSNLDG
jgi:hypothetical protein